MMMQGRAALCTYSEVFVISRIIRQGRGRGYQPKPKAEPRQHQHARQPCAYTKSD